MHSFAIPAFARRSTWIECLTRCHSLQFSLSPRAFACVEQALRRHGRDTLTRHVRGRRLAPRAASFPARAAFVVQLFAFFSHACPAVPPLIPYSTRLKESLLRTCRTRSSPAHAVKCRPCNVSVPSRYMSKYTHIIRNHGNSFSRSLKVRPLVKCLFL